MSLKQLLKMEAKVEFDKLVENNFNPISDIPEEYREIRIKLVNKFNELESLNFNKYKMDLHFGLYLYELLNSIFYFNEKMADASNMGFWYYLSIKILPDLVYKRWEEKNLATRFYKTDKRVWLFSMWIYIHLSWQGSIEDTRIVLENNNTDIIVQIIERAGEGYEIELIRQLMKQIYQKGVQSLIRRIMVLNTIYLKTIEPQIFTGGYEGYVKMLIEKASN